jgi:hypothetical protein
MQINNRRDGADNSYLPGVSTSRPGTGGPGFGANRLGGTIPSPRQMTLEEARRRSLMERPEMAPEAPMTPGDIGGMSDDELARFSEQYNMPQMDLNDAVFGPDTRGMNLIEMLINSLSGRR